MRCLSHSFARIGSSRARGHPTVAFLAGVVATFVTLIDSPFAAAGPNCFAEGKSIWRQCPALCMTECKNPSIDLHATREICLILARMPVRKDDPTCTDLLAEQAPAPTPTPPPGPPPVPGQSPDSNIPGSQPIQACVNSAKSGPGLMDRLNKKIQTKSLRDALARRLENPAPPSDCAPNPAALRLIYDCISTEAGRIEQEYRNLQSKLGIAEPGKRCGRPVSDYDKAYQTLDILKQRSAFIQNYSEQELVKCNGRWNEWLDAKLKPDAEAPINDTFHQVITDLKNDLNAALDTRKKVEQAISGITKALNGVEADVISSLLGCND